jgi:hypothetical protein
VEFIIFLVIALPIILCIMSFASKRNDIIASSEAIASANKDLKNKLIENCANFVIEDISRELVVGINMANNSLLILDKSQNGTKVYTGNDIIDCEIIENGVVINSSTRSIGGAIVGGLLAGPAGAVIGGLGKANSTSNIINDIHIKMTTADNLKPVTRICLFKASDFTGGGISKSSDKYQSIRKLYDEWQGAFRVIADRSRRVNAPSQDATDKTSSENALKISIGSELEKLSLLRDRGDLTNAEFQQLKSKLLEQ